MLEIKLLKGASIKGYKLVEGFPGIGLVGPMTISYMIDKLKMEYCGYIDSDKFPPIISIHEGRAMPSVRLYSSDKIKAVIVFAEFAIPVSMVYDLTQKLYEFIKANGLTEIISINGMPTGSASLEETGISNDKVYSIASSKKLAQDAAKAGMIPITEGVATGVSALLLLNAVTSQIDDINILVPVNQNIIDPKYAELAIQSINKMLNLKIDITELDKESKEVEAKIKDLIKKSKETHDTFKKASEDSGPSMYA
ncbi:MAG: PAC2 family protein [Candidatus Marsarchaeota archaeon]|jgi:uncharacterized protein|nr:PAC2 family protein [Candidatus Marsarchaeota archaeon]